MDSLKVQTREELELGIKGDEGTRGLFFFFFIVETQKKSGLKRSLIVV